MDDEMLGIPATVIDKVTAALNMAVGITLVHAKECHSAILEAAVALDEAVNDALAMEE